MDRELSTQKEVTKQLEVTRQEYIAKLKKEIAGQHEVAELDLMKNAMVGEDYRTRIVENLQIIIEQKDLLKMMEDKLLTAESDLIRKDTELNNWIL